MALRQLLRGWRLAAVLILPVLAAVAAAAIASGEPAAARATLRAPIPAAADAAPSVLTQRFDELQVAVADPTVLGQVAPASELSQAQMRAGLSVRRAGGSDVMVVSLEGPASADLAGDLEAVVAAAMAQVLADDVALATAEAEASSARVAVLEEELATVLAASGAPRGAEDYRAMASTASQLRIRALEAELDPDGVDAARVAGLRAAADEIDRELAALGEQLLVVDAVEDRLTAARRTDEQALLVADAATSRRDRALAAIPAAATTAALSSSLPVVQSAVTAAVLVGILVLLALLAVEAVARSRRAAEPSVGAEAAATDDAAAAPDATGPVDDDDDVVAVHEPDQQFDGRARRRTGDAAPALASATLGELIESIVQRGRASLGDPVGASRLGGESLAQADGHHGAHGVLGADGADHANANGHANGNGDASGAEHADRAAAVAASAAAALVDEPTVVDLTDEAANEPDAPVAEGDETVDVAASSTPHPRRRGWFRRRTGPFAVQLTQPFNPEPTPLRRG